MTFWFKKTLIHDITD